MFIYVKRTVLKIDIVFLISASLVYSYVLFYVFSSHSYSILHRIFMNKINIALHQTRARWDGRFRGNLFFPIFCGSLIPSFSLINFSGLGLGSHQVFPNISIILIRNNSTSIQLSRHLKYLEYFHQNNSKMDM